MEEGGGGGLEGRSYGRVQGSDGGGGGLQHRNKHRIGSTKEVAVVLKTFGVFMSLIIFSLRGRKDKREVAANSFKLKVGA